MDIKFNNLEELKERIMPALRIRKRELKKQNLKIAEEDIWNYFKNNKWSTRYNLSLADMVDDILNQPINLEQDVI